MAPDKASSEMKGLIRLLYESAIPRELQNSSQSVCGYGRRPRLSCKRGQAAFLNRETQPLILPIEPVYRCGKMLAQHHRFQNELNRLFEGNITERGQPLAQMKK